MPEPDRRQARRLSGCPGAQILKTWEAMTRMDRRLMVVTTTRGFPSSAILKSCTLRFIMASKQDRILEDFAQCFCGLISLFRSRRYLDIDDQMFIENRIILLKLEYNLWAAGLRNTPRTSAVTYPTNHNHSSSRDSSS
jgi:hypothetical protein